ncbi:gfo/Idh/MocA family oxidoreductase [Aquimarina sp. AD10]|uniref:Gfo/Idh/MocA family protein n=1 Tax=Aquimarina sp. AD10 TaxID=1714849 RepID=UPI000E54E4AB|nr:Gfo/Idh/MocA family oxidoreductase [Aquimarina sp. AD10]AXT61212.1 gfo/Idh/MocA family oxidoreductase [Aquimarina sp. AD10]RKN02171.1 gfo/Idh/MocA family oxidoreductase [Aquimarina sp. AD10]
MTKKLKGVAIGAGYFSRFQYEAWTRIPEVAITALCDLNTTRAKEVKNTYLIKKQYQDYKEMLIQEKPDFVDIITPPETHFEMCCFAADQGIDIICQKPLAPTYEEAIRLVAYVKSKGVRFVVHENFRFQPWHREIKKIIDHNEIGDLFNLNFRSRLGDGWGNDAYLERQPYFRDYEKLLIYETGVHYIDTFRYHAGEIKNVYAILKKLNPIIKGEDCGMMILNFKNNAHATWDANRYNESNYLSPRYTFGEYLIDGSKGSIRLYPDGKITIQLLGQNEKEHAYTHNDIGFAGDCCYLFQRDYVDNMIFDGVFETNVDNYLKNLSAQEAVYQSAKINMPVEV